MLLCTLFGEDTSNNAVALNNLRDLENEVKFTQFELCLHLAFMLLHTNFGEDTSNISSDNEREPSMIYGPIE